MALSRAYQRLRAKSPASTGEPLRIAVLGVGTTDLIVSPLALALDAWGIDAVLEKGAYNAFARDMLDPAGAVVRFRPNVSVIVNTPLHLPAKPAPDDGVARAAELAEEVAQHWLGLCRALHDLTGCEIVLDNYHLFPHSPNGMLSRRIPSDVNGFLRRVNQGLSDHAPEYVHIHDVELLAGREGLDRWFEPRAWFEAKLPMSHGALLPYVRGHARVVGALYGRAAKCVVLDLDNTLWGGVVGDDGVDGIVVGPGDPRGEAFLAFQEYLLGLKRRGILLAVSSKNEAKLARAPFEVRPEMALRLTDIVAFRANWDPKPGNVREIARSLNLGLDSVVFVDDNPREREHVRQELPEVRVVELTDDVADYPRLLDETGWLEAVRVTDEDLARTRHYQSNERRDELREASGSYEAYLASLQQVAVIAPYESRHLDRIAQLVNKTNQFNLTTRRQTRSEVEAEMNDPRRLTAYVRVADRFGDNGLVSVFSAHRSADQLEIDQWLMSCRVLNRGVERLLFNWVADQARRTGVRTVAATYLPTPKNGLIKELLPSLGFDSADGADVPDGATRWVCRLEDFEPAPVQIRQVEDY